MFEFDFSRLFPRFLLNDKNGYAMAKAIEAGLNYFLEKCQDGLDCVQNVEKMPEWRLDEMAWEYNILYDYAAPVATKRIWIANAIEYYAKYGTAAAITKYLEGVFGSVNVEEWWEYEGDPCHFRVVVTGEWSEEADAWAKKAIAEVQNVRSILDNIIYNSGGAEIPLYVAAAPFGIDITYEAKMLG